jgi:hypothetical protein
VLGRRHTSWIYGRGGQLLHIWVQDLRSDTFRGWNHSEAEQNYLRGWCCWQTPQWGEQRVINIPKAQRAGRYLRLKLEGLQVLRRRAEKNTREDGQDHSSWRPVF